MTRSRLLRSLRITWTVICGIACALLIVLWVRSYWRNSSLSSNINTSTGSPSCVLQSSRGQLSIVRLVKPGDLQTMFNWQAGTIPTVAGFGGRRYGSSFFILFPYWFLTLASCAFGAVLWLPFKRFSLRTLLIATTLVAVVLGLIVWLR